MGMCFKWRLSWLQPVAGLVLFCSLTDAGRAGLADLPDKWFVQAEQRWGHGAAPRLAQWQRLLRDNTAARAVGRPDATSLRQVNDFFNQVPFSTDIQHWGAEDYWATPSELLASFAGDCEDYAIAKYLSLKEIGIPVAQLRMTYVRVVKRDEPHMVLAYYPSPGADPLILDNLVGDIRSATQRTDLEPVYGFNEDDLWVAGSAVKTGGASHVRLWRELLARMAKEKRS